MELNMVNLAPDRPIGLLGRKMDPPFQPKLLRLEDFLQPTAQLVYPKDLDYNTKVTKPIPMYGNDKYGDCTCAAMARLIQELTSITGKQTILPDATVVKIYLTLTGGKDVGLYLTDVLKYSKKTGFADHPIGAYVAVNPQNAAHMKYAAYTFGAVYTGFDLPIRCEAQFKAGKPWAPVNADLSGDDEPGSLGGHAMTTGSYHPWGWMLDTWGTVQPATNAWMAGYCSEAYAILTLDWFAANHKTPLGMAWKDLLAALTKVTGG